MQRVLVLLFLFIQSVNAQQPVLGADTGKGRFIHFTPVSFSNMFSLNLAPALHIRSGDTVSTETIDASGHDKNGVRRQKGGNPLTGPFYIANCQEGDVFQITLVNITLNVGYS